jgi:hypothetical protein
VKSHSQMKDLNKKDGRRETCLFVVFTLPFTFTIIIINIVATSSKPNQTSREQEHAGGGAMRAANLLMISDTDNTLIRSNWSTTS